MSWNFNSDDNPNVKERALIEAIMAKDKVKVDQIIHEYHHGGLNPNAMLRCIFERACRKRELPLIDEIFKFDYTKWRPYHIDPIEPDHIWERVLELSLSRGNTRVLKHLLDRWRISVHRSFAPKFGGPLICAVRAFDVELVNWLMLHNSDPSQGLLHNRYNIFHVLGESVRRNSRLGEVLRMCELILLDGTGTVAGTGLLQAIAANNDHQHIEKKVRVAELILSRRLESGVFEVWVDAIPQPKNLLFNSTAQGTAWRIQYGTALFEAVKSKSTDMVKLLLKEGADPYEQTRPDSDSAPTIMQWAELRKGGGYEEYADIVNLMKEAQGEL